MNTRRVALFSLPCAVLVACSEKNNVDKPVAPDMSGLLAAYEHPTAELSAETAAQAVSEQLAVAAFMQRVTAAFPEIESAVSEGLVSDGDSDPLGGGESGRRPLEVTGAGYLKVVRICPGPDPDAAPNRENGTLNLTIGFTEQGVDPVVWGTIEACQFLSLDEVVTLDGAIELHVGENLQFDGFGSAAVLVRLEGSLDVAGASESLDTDFRILPSGALEYRLAVEDGHFIYWENVSERGLRAANGSYGCDFEARQCSNDSGEQVAW